MKSTSASQVVGYLQMISTDQIMNDESGRNRQFMAIQHKLAGATGILIKGSFEVQSVMCI